MRRVSRDARLLVLCGLLLTGHAAAQETAAVIKAETRSPTPDQIRAGFIAMETRVFALYPVPYRYHSGIEWRRRFRTIQRNAADMTPAQVFVEAARVMGMLRDAHSWASIDNGAPLLSRAVPLRFWWFDDGLYIRAASPENAPLVGARVEGIEGVPVEEVLTRLTAVQPGANAMQGLVFAQIYLEFPEYLHAIGIGKDDAALSLTLTLSSGERRTVSVPPVQYADYSEAYLASKGFTTPAGWAEPPAAQAAIWMAQRAKPFWYRHDPLRRLVYLQINEGVLDPEHPYDTEVDRYTPFIKELFEFIAAQGVQTLVVDLRHNAGGDSRMYDPLVRGIIRSQVLDRPGHTFVLTSRLTESAAVAWCAQLEGATAVLFAGEMTADPPNYYNDPAGFRRETFHIPGSRVNYRIARALDIWSAASTDERVGIAPDLPATMRYADFASGRDTAMERVLSLNPQSARVLFETKDGDDTTEYPYLHYRRLSQDVARDPR